ncbi:MAG TPA: VOC family protein [Verrucomicrobiae bacterium]|nr:VOC family protein [Verrucomicrobiae bacterium]
MQLNAYLMFKGECEEAFKFYERCLGGKIQVMMRYGESPMAKQTAPDWQKKVIHTRLTVGNQVFMGSDAPPERFKSPQGFAMSIGVDDPQEAERIFQELSENGNISMPIQETFWALRFGMVTDRFGTPWMVNCEKQM